MRDESPKRGRPLGRCPKCGKYYVTRNVWHACRRHSLGEHFAGRDPKLRFLFDGVVGLLKRNGPLRIVPGKTGIAFQVRMCFGGVCLRKNSLDLSFLLTRRLEEPRIRKIVPYSPRCYGHHVTIATPADLDAELAAWLREAYRVGQQTERNKGKTRRRVQEGGLEWSRLADAKTSAKPQFPQMLEAASARSKRTKSSWRCPKCGRRFPARNQIHICSNLALHEALQGKTLQSIALFRRVAALVRRFGAVELIPQKTRIAFQARKIFLSVRFLRDAIDCEISLPRRIEDSRFLQILSASRGLHYHYLRISSLSQLGGNVRGWLRESFLSSQ